MRQFLSRGDIVRLATGLFFVLFIFSMCMITACDSSNCVESQFGWIKIVFPDLGEPLQENSDWHRVYSLTDEQMEKTLSMDFKEQGYSGWKSYRDRLLLMGGAYELDGHITPTQVCYKEDGSYKFNPPYNFIAMFVETERKRFVLVYGITYGR